MRVERPFENLFRNAVEHDGSGVPPDHRAQVFESDFTTGEEGIELDLSIVEGVVAAHGWRIFVTNGMEAGPDSKSSTSLETDTPRRETRPKAYAAAGRFHGHDRRNSRGDSRDANALVIGRRG
ncbi:MAG: ATP-binding protein [Halobacteriota archaeon]|uniref:ATP-binding protein n=1 Tax=Natronomonas sp. TaxID=2184060 RepID=UPI003975934B